MKISDIPSMNDRQRLLFLILILAIVGIFIAGVTNFFLYNAAFEQNRERLLVSAQSQARIMEAVARFDRLYSTDYPKGAAAATISQIQEAHDNFELFGETGEFTVARREGDQIIFLFRQHRHDLVIPNAVPFDSELAEPMRQALLGRSGTLVGLDYRGETVLAAFEPVAVLNLGIVAKIDLTEIRAPFVRTGITAVILSFFAIVAGAFLFVRTTNPMIRRMHESKESESQAHAYLNHAIENMPAGFMLFDKFGQLVLSNSLIHEYFPEHDKAGLFKPGSLFDDLVRFTSQSQTFADTENSKNWIERRLNEFKSGSAINVEVLLRSGRWLQVLDRKTTEG